MHPEKIYSLKDEDIIDKILKGSSSNHFEVIYKRHYRKVFDNCNRLVKNSKIAKELTEDIFSKCYEKLPTFKNKSAFSSWLSSITYNYCIDFLREKKKLHYQNWSNENELPEIIDESFDDAPDINYENLEIILERIHPEEKAILLMKYMENLSIKEIGIALRISEDAAKMRLKRARSRVLYLYSECFLNIK